MGVEDGKAAMFYSDCAASYLASHDRIEQKKKKVQWFIRKQIHFITHWWSLKRLRKYCKVNVEKSVPAHCNLYKSNFRAESQR